MARAHGRRDHLPPYVGSRLSPRASLPSDSTSNKGVSRASSGWKLLSGLPAFSGSDLPPVGARADSQPPPRPPPLSRRSRPPAPSAPPPPVCHRRRCRKLRVQSVPSDEAPSDADDAQLGFKLQPPRRDGLLRESTSTRPRPGSSCASHGVWSAVRTLGIRFLVIGMLTILLFCMLATHTSDERADDEVPHGRVHRLSRTRHPRNSRRDDRQRNTM